VVPLRRSARVVSVPPSSVNAPSASMEPKDESRRPLAAMVRLPSGQTRAASVAPVFKLTVELDPTTNDPVPPAAA